MPKSTTTTTCCVPEPSPGQLFLKSYNFQTNGTSGSSFAVFGIFQGQNATLQRVYLDQTLLTKSNSGLNATCGPIEVAQYTSDECTVSVSFGPSLPVPAERSTHTLEIVASTGTTSTFQVTAGYLYEATSTG